MYAILVDFLLVALILAFGALLFLGSAVVVLLDATSQAAAKAAKRYAQALARLQWQTPQPPLEPNRATVRARLHV